MKTKQFSQMSGVYEWLISRNVHMLEINRILNNTLKDPRLKMTRHWEAITISYKLVEIW